MTAAAKYRTGLENRRVYDLIWSQMPEMQNSASSSWWFFLMFPRDEEGYGPRQLMYTIATRAGEKIRVNDIWLPGLDLRRRVTEGVDRFHAMNVAWYCDGRRMHDYLIKEAAPVTLSENEHCIRSWSESTGNGIEIRSSAGRPLALESHMHGPNGSAHFEAWGVLDSKHSSPHESVNIDTPAGGTHFIAWRRMEFEGEFDLPDGKQFLSGLCYFQRVCLNVPTFPWKWIWSLFPDGTMFSSYVPYVGMNLLRKGYKFFGRERLEQATIPIGASAFWDRPDTSEEIRFEQASVTPLLGLGPHPQFAVRVSNRAGDYLSFRAETYGHTRFFIDRPILGNRLETHWSYNEYMFRMADLDGSVSGKPITWETMGQNFGNLEYSWGLGL